MASHLQLRRQSLILFGLLATACSAGPTGLLGDESPSSRGTGGITATNSNADSGAARAGTIVLEADTACPKIDDDGEMIAPAPDAPRFTHLGVVGSRRFASSEENLVVFDADGTNASDPFAPPGTDLLGAESDGMTIGAVSTKTASSRFARYDANGAKMNLVTLDATSSIGDPGLSIASSGTSFLAIRAQGTSLEGVEIAASVGQSSTFGTGTFGAELSVASVHDASGYAVVWAGEIDGTWNLHFMRWGHPKDARVVLTSTAPLRASRLVTTSTGFIALLGGADVAALDANGALVGPVHRYQGALYAWDLASNGSALALVAKRASGEPMLRTLDTSGAPTADWVCLDDSIGKQVGGAAVDADRSGKHWAVVHTTPKGGARFIRL